MKIIKRFWLYPAGAIIGGGGGYLYWYYIGCASGTCPITSSPVLSIIWGALMGGLIFSLFIKKQSTDK